MRLYLLQDSSGEIIAAHTDREIIRLHFYSSQKSLEIWILETADSTGVGAGSEFRGYADSPNRCQTGTGRRALQNPAEQYPPIGDADGPR